MKQHTMISQLNETCGFNRSPFVEGTLTLLLFFIVYDFHESHSHIGLCMIFCCFRNIWCGSHKATIILNMHSPCYCFTKLDF